MYIATSQEMRNIDRRAEEEYGIPSIVLMENAARGVVKVAGELIGAVKDKKITVFAGKGNNGGDGLAAARHLHNEGANVYVFLLSEAEVLKGDGEINLRIARKMDIPIFGSNQYNRDMLTSRIKESDLIIDAMLGTGLSSEVRGGYKDVIEMINRSGKPTIAVDIPTGINADTGEIMGIGIKASATVTFALPKRAHFLFPGPEYTGKLHVVDISIPFKAIEQEGIYLQLITEEWIKKTLTPRPPDSHKGTFGHAVVIAGSIGKGGAAAMTALGALRSGAGLVTLGLPASVQSIVAGNMPEIMTAPLPETYNKTISFTAIEPIMELIKDKDVVAIGPGLTTNKDTQTVVRKLIKELHIPIVIDADGLNALVGYVDTLKERESPTVLTPHPGEMARLIGKTSADVQRDRIGIARTFALDYKVYLVLKGAHTVIAEPSGKVYISTTGNPGMATGGTGDVLTGVIAGLIAQRYSVSEAVRIGVFVHGLAGNIGANRRGMMGMIAGDLIDSLPEAFKQLS